MNPAIMRAIIPPLLSLMNKIVPDGMKVYAVALVGIVFAITLFVSGDYTNGGMLLWFSVLALAGRHTAEKLTDTISVASSGVDRDG